MRISTTPNWNKIMTHPLQKCKLGNVYQKFNLKDIGCDINDFQPLRLSYNNLPIDLDYPLNNKVLSRFRRYSEFTIDVTNPNQFLIQPNHNYQFSQDVPDFRNKSRTFTPMETYVLNDKFFYLVTQILGITLSIQPEIQTINISCHQVRLLSFPDLDSDNAPEGIHKDGADYIVSALILNRHNIVDGISNIYNSKQELLEQHQLQLGEFIFQEDRELWHDITPIKSKKPFIGYRDILGFDLKIIE